MFEIDFLIIEKHDLYLNKMTHCRTQEDCKEAFNDLITDYVKTTY
jgi:hypothetical protein